MAKRTKQSGNNFRSDATKAAPHKAKCPMCKKIHGPISDFRKYVYCRKCSQIAKAVSGIRVFVPEFERKIKAR